MIYVFDCVCVCVDCQSHINHYGRSDPPLIPHVDNNWNVNRLVDFGLQNCNTFSDAIQNSSLQPFHNLCKIFFTNVTLDVKDLDEVEMFLQFIVPLTPAMLEYKKEIKDKKLDKLQLNGNTKAGVGCNWEARTIENQIKSRINEKYAKIIEKHEKSSSFINDMNNIDVSDVNNKNGFNEDQLKLLQLAQWKSQIEMLSFNDVKMQRTDRIQNYINRELTNERIITGLVNLKSIEYTKYFYYYENPISLILTKIIDVLYKQLESLHIKTDVASFIRSLSMCDNDEKKPQFRSRAAARRWKFGRDARTDSKKKYESFGYINSRLKKNQENSFVFCYFPNLIELCIVDESDGWKHIVTQWIIGSGKLKRLKIYPLVYGWQDKDNYLTRITQDNYKSCCEKDSNIDRTDNNISFGNDMSKFINKGLELLHLKLNVQFNFNIIPASNTFDNVFHGIVDAKGENEMLVSFYNALIDMFKNKIYLKNENNFTFKIEFYTRLTAKQEYLQCIFNKHQITGLIYSMMQIYHSICFGIKVVFVNDVNNIYNINNINNRSSDDENEYEKMKCHFEKKIINPLKSSLDLSSPFGLKNAVTLYIDSNISWMKVQQEKSFAVVIKVNNNGCHTSPQFKFACSDCKSGAWLENECCDHKRV